MMNNKNKQENNLDEKIYQELKVIANKLMRHERINHTLSPTDLVHEAFLKISQSKLVDSNEGHYLFVLARQMRRLLVNYGRQRSALKRGSNQKFVLYTDSLGINNNQFVDFNLISQAIDELVTINPRCAKVIELYYFTGITRVKVAETLKVSIPTLERDTRFAKAYINNYLDENS